MYVVKTRAPVGRGGGVRSENPGASEGGGGGGGSLRSENPGACGVMCVWGCLYVVKIRTPVERMGGGLCPL